jgi:hypothetical protein
MKLALLVALALTTATCGRSTPPTAPTLPPTAPSNPPVFDPPAPTPPPAPVGTGVLWVVVLQEGEGVCVTGAAVAVIVDGAVVQSKTQQPCSYWDPDYDLVFKDLPGTGVRVRASASGYVTREINAIPSSGRTLRAVAIELQRANQ